MTKGIRVKNIMKADIYICACAILHNIAIPNKEDEPPNETDIQGEGEVVEEAKDSEPRDIVPDDNERNRRFQRRRGLINYFGTLLRKYFSTGNNYVN